MLLAIILMIAGGVIGFGSFAYAAKNFIAMLKEGKSFLTVFKHHVGVMVGMAFGGFVFLAGGIILIVHAI